MNNLNDMSDLSDQKKSDLIARRTIFYCNNLYKLQQLIKDIEQERANKWYNNDDDNAVSEILSFLYHAEVSFSKRYGDVLNERADDLLSRLEAGID